MTSSHFAAIVTSNADFSRLSLCLIWITDFNPYHSINSLMSWVFGGLPFLLVFRREHTAVSLMNPFHKLSDFCFPVCVVSTLLVCLTTQTCVIPLTFPWYRSRSHITQEQEKALRFHGIWSRNKRSSFESLYFASGEIRARHKANYGSLQILQFSSYILLVYLF
jgi:hypothetical protein